MNLLTPIRQILEKVTVPKQFWWKFLKDPPDGYLGAAYLYYKRHPLVVALVRFNQKSLFIFKHPACKDAASQVIDFELADPCLFESIQVAFDVVVEEHLERVRFKTLS